MVPYLLLVYVVYFFFFKQKTAYEMRISDWSSDVCSSDLRRQDHDRGGDIAAGLHPRRGRLACDRGTHHPAARDHRVGVVRAYAFLAEPELRRALETHIVMHDLGPFEQTDRKSVG